MYNQLRILGIALLLLSAGCQDSKWAFLRSSHDNAAVAGQKAPTEAELVNYLNYNSQRIQSIHVKDLQLDGQQGMSSFGLNGWMICRKSRDFRLQADAIGKTMTDIGSNDREFWYWIAKADPPYLIHCSYADLRSGNVELPFPFQPEWVMEALGMGEYGSAENYKLVTSGRTYQLGQDTVGSQGQRVRKIVVFNRDPAKFQVVQHVLQDGNGKEICTAYISDAQYIKSAGVTIPKRVVLRWPAQKLQLTLRLDDVVVNPPIEPDRAVAIFTRPIMQGVQSVDLARRQIDGPADQLRPAGGFGAR
jgi:hypothetical protein